MFLAKFDDGFCTNDFEKLIDLTEPYFRWMAKVKDKKKPDKLTLTVENWQSSFGLRSACQPLRKH